LRVAFAGRGDASTTASNRRYHYLEAHGTRAEVPLGPDDGLDHDSVIDADDLVTLDTEILIRRLAALSPSKLAVLAEALRIALALPRFEQQ
jgi:mRNA-degrading endonuclease toxin of MazEF toxin-antitoxin module